MATGKDELKLRRQVWRLAQPLDLVELERKGLVEKRGAWYRVPDKAKLPEHVWVKATTIKQGDGDVLFQFSTAVKKSQALATKMSIDWKGAEPE